MHSEKAIIIFNITKRKLTVDLEIPLDISANELVTALNTAYVHSAVTSGRWCGGQRPECGMPAAGLSIRL